MVEDRYGRSLGEERMRRRVTGTPMSGMRIDAIRLLAERVTPADIAELKGLQKSGADPSALFRRVPALCFQAKQELDLRNDSVVKAVFGEKSESASEVKPADKPVVVPPAKPARKARQVRKPRAEKTPAKRKYTKRAEKPRELTVSFGALPGIEFILSPFFGFRRSR